MKLCCHVILFFLFSGCASVSSRTPSPAAPSPEREESQVRAHDETPLALDHLTSLSSSAFGFASLNWESNVSDFDAVFGPRVSDNPVNPRLRYTCHEARLGIDPVSVCAAFSSGTASYVYVVAQADYTGEQLEDAFAEWRDRLEERLSEGEPASFYHEGTSLDWYLDDETKVRLSKEGGSLRIDFWSNSPRSECGGCL